MADIFRHPEWADWWERVIKARKARDEEAEQARDLARHFPEPIEQEDY